ncbi:thioesterase II family protein [Streptomyces qinglanensis]|uniref:Surfactin synthase thioesterase subunit n=1 Tax=Streptomyces qinglanensis TaxID=943816 RepID=A0A1H9RCJ4_9ACTN|nr:alpha/beta fold hydrolase [Streptomyces qinglanensis]SER70651.1 Surfactin synthase thioesterase subunit [Streptomyces qinglanensis]
MTTASGDATGHSSSRVPRSGGAGRWLRLVASAPNARARLICFPHAGGSAGFFFPLLKSLPSAVEAYAVQYPGRQDRLAEPCLTSVDELADAVCEVLRQEPAMPQVLFGHSMGATVAFEVARRQERSGGGSPLGLVVSGRRAPSLRHAETVHQRDDDGLVAEIRRLNGTDDSLLDDPEIRRMFLPALRADYQAIETYRMVPGPPLRCPLSVFVGDADPRVSVAEAEAWREQSGGGISLQVFPGGHFYLSDRPQEFSDRLTAELTRLCGPVAGGR